ncbi:hypothetical protein MP228_003856 [Amoeboaphelidium protococcarum]|nr:hypothetical protein MP228_003856 [Amoeboaphelidium protococcarum]
MDRQFNGLMQDSDNENDVAVQCGPHAFVQIASHLTQLSLADELLETDDVQSILSTGSKIQNANVTAGGDTGRIRVSLSREELNNLSAGETDQSSRTLQQLNGKLCQIFELPELEEFQKIHTCWLVNNVMIRGYLFLCKTCVCFLAQLPKEQNIYKEGFLLKKGKKRAQYFTYWVVLKDNLLTYYDSGKDTYFPLGTINLKSAIGINLVKRRKNGFKIICPDRRFYFIADSYDTMQQWIQMIENCIAKARLQDDSLKLVLPYDEITTTKVVESKIMSNCLLINCTPQEVVDSTTVDASHTQSQQAGFFNSVKSIQFLSASTANSTDSYSGDMDEFAFAYLSDIQQVQSELKRLIALHSQSSLNGISPPAQRKSLSKHQQRESVSTSSGIMAQGDNSAFLRKHFSSLFQNDQNVEILFKCGAYIQSQLSLVPKLGQVFLTGEYLLFYSKVIGVRTKAVIPLQDIIIVQKRKSPLALWSGLYVAMKNGETWLEFSAVNKRDTLHLLLQNLIKIKYATGEYRHLNAPSQDEDDEIDDESLVDDFTRLSVMPSHPASIGDSPQVEGDSLVHSLMHDISSLTENPASLSSTSLQKSLHIFCQTIGTRGDVQPFIALCKALLKDGHQCTIATHQEYQSWIESHGISFRPISGNPAELMKLCVDNGMFSISFFREAAVKFRAWLDDLLISSYEALKGADVVIESPVAMAGYHVAEKLQVPYFAAFPMPWTRTSDFPHPFAVADYSLGLGYNLMSWSLMDNLLWRGQQPQINKFRTDVLKLQPLTSGAFFDQHQVPFLYSFSNQVVKLPSDWKTWNHITGYWFLDEPEKEWRAEESLQNFIHRVDDRPLVYIGFGSIIVPDAQEMTRSIIQAVKIAQVRAIICKGWSSRGSDTIDLNQQPQQDINGDDDDVYFISSVPHDWLFPKVQIVVHHGGAGTTAAGLRSGCVTIIKPFFGDQYFWASRVAALGVGLQLRKLDVSSLADTLVRAAQDQNMKIKAQALGEKIRSQNGVHVAKSVIYKELPRLLEGVARQKSMMEAKRVDDAAGKKSILDQLALNIGSLTFKHRFSSPDSPQRFARDDSVISSGGDDQKQLVDADQINFSDESSQSKMFKFKDVLKTKGRRKSIAHPLSSQEDLDEEGYNSDASIEYGGQSLSRKPSKLRRKRPNQIGRGGSGAQHSSQSALDKKPMAQADGGRESGGGKKLKDLIKMKSLSFLQSSQPSSAQQDSDKKAPATRQLSFGKFLLQSRKKKSSISQADMNDDTQAQADDQ